MATIAKETQGGFDHKASASQEWVIPGLRSLIVSRIGSGANTGSNLEAGPAISTAHSTPGPSLMGD
jgi:hypothetical protein